MALFSTKINDDGKSFEECIKLGKLELRWSTRFDKMQIAIGDVRPGEIKYFVTCATWSMYELLEYVLRHERIRNADVDCFTWNVGMAAVQRFSVMQDEGIIKRLRMLCHSTMVRFVADAISVLRKRAKVALLPNHAKGFLIDDGKRKIVCIGSANFNNNNQIEAGVIQESDELFFKMREWLEPIFNDNKLLAPDQKEQPGFDFSDHGKLLTVIHCEEHERRADMKRMAGNAISEDDFFTDSKSVYVFEHANVGRARIQIFENAKLAMEQEEPVVSVIYPVRKDELDADLDKIAKIYGYRIETMELK